jgi:hypothetical protein
MYYGNNDGVTAGNTNLRVAYSANNRATWNGLSNSAHTTAPTDSITEIRATALASGNPVLTTGQSMYIALARATGSTENSLEPSGTSVGEKSETPSTFVLSQNYPNPFNPSTMISYQLPENNHVTVSVFDAIGREVVALVNEVQEAGIYSVQFDASRLSSGLYFYQMRAGKFIENKKMMLLK